MNTSVSTSENKNSSPNSSHSKIGAAASCRRAYKGRLPSAAVFSTDVFAGVFTDVFPDVVIGAFTYVFIGVLTGVFTGVFTDVITVVFTYVCSSMS